MTSSSSSAWKTAHIPWFLWKSKGVLLPPKKKLWKPLDAKVLNVAKNGLEDRNQSAKLYLCGDFRENIRGSECDSECESESEDVLMDVALALLSSELSKMVRTRCVGDEDRHRNYGYHGPPEPSLDTGGHRCWLSNIPSIKSCASGRPGTPIISTLDRKSVV